MAKIKLENEELTVLVDELGAQMVSLIEKKTGKEYMWCADPKFWGKCSPILFPFVGQCADKEYTYKNKTYPMKIHGFADESIFEVTDKSEDRATFTLTDSEKTLGIYPFKFRLDVIFKLTGRMIEVSYKVKNPSNEEMYFMIGAHPGFNCPINENEKRKDCFVKFYGKDEIVSRGLDLDHGLVNEVNTVFELRDELLPITDNLFDADALVIENQGIKKVSLVGGDKVPFVTVTMDAPVYGIWSCYTPGTPYVCIEPWFGRCDKVGSDKELSHRDFVNHLDAQGEFETSYTIEI